MPNKKDPMLSLSKTLRAFFLGVALVALMVACTGYIALSEIRRPADSSDTPVKFVVAPGDSTTRIATGLRDSGLIRQPLLFTLLVRTQGFDGELQSGTYTLQPNMTMSEIISLMRTTRPQGTEVRVLIREGERLEQMAESLAAAGMANVTAEAFLSGARNPAPFKDHHPLLRDLPPDASLEGYLFPDTYRFAATATVTDVLDTMLGRFDEQYEQVRAAVSVPNLTTHQLVTMASIVQREAGDAEEMPRIAAVFWNRLKPEYQNETGGGRLQADPTLQYILGKPGDWWPKLDALTTEQINSAGKDTPLAAYNTRVTLGLPPGPISSPGLDALKAAAQPDSQPYLYFVAKCNGPGHNFATSNEEFQQFQAEYLSCPKR